MTRPLGKERAQAHEKLAPLLSISEPGESTHPSKFFSKKFKEHWLEIGFGSGEHLFALMEQHPDIAFIGAEPFINGIAAFMQHLGQHKTVIPNECEGSLAYPSAKDPSSAAPPQDDGLGNIRVFPDDAMLLVEKLDGESLNRIYILNPDPWPKKRHHKRRIISRQNLAEFIRVLKPGGRLLLSTDVDGLAEWMVTQCMNCGGLEWTATASKDWKNPPAGWASSTRYADWGKESGRKMTYLAFKKTCKS